MKITQKNRIALAAVAAGMLAGCYTGTEVSDTQVDHFTVQLSEPVPISTVTERLPDDVLIENVSVQFEPGRLGLLLLTEPTRSPEFVLAQHQEAQEVVHRRLRAFLGVKSPDGYDIQGELEHLASIESKPLTPETLLVVQVAVSGPSEQINAFVKDMSEQNG